ncbi:MAG: VPLPA-CTERM sorting domain-containing protein [Pseudomonadota bacterium]
MNFLRVLALAAAPFAASAASAATITISGQALIDAETTVAGEFGYQIDLSALGLKSVSSVTITDSALLSETGGQTTGFDVDALVIGSSTSSFTAASSFQFTAGGMTSGTQLKGATAGNAGVDNSVATLGTFDGTTSPLNGFLSLGNGGSLTAFFNPAVAVAGTLFTFASDVGTDERLAEITISGAVPLPASGLLMLGGLGAVGFMRRRRKAA